MIFIILIPVILVNLNYLDDFLSSNNIYDLNINFFLNKLNFLPLGIDYLFSSILNILTHLVLLLSFREQAYTEFLLFFSNNNSYLIIYLVMGIVFFLYHFFGFFYFIKTKFKDNPYLIVILLSLMPNLFLVSHMRYFMPMMPISIIGICLLLQTYNQKK